MVLFGYLIIVQLNQDKSSIHSKDKDKGLRLWYISFSLDVMCVRRNI